MAVPFDQLDGQIWFNGEFVDWKDAKIHVLTHGLHYASAVFEGERAYGGRIFKLSAPMAAASSSSPSITSACTSPPKSSASRFPIPWKSLMRRPLNS